MTSLSFLHIDSWIVLTFYFSSSCVVYHDIFQSVCIFHHSPTSYHEVSSIHISKLGSIFFPYLLREEKTAGISTILHLRLWRSWFNLKKTERF
jgi:hypothetical protein